VIDGPDRMSLVESVERVADAAKRHGKAWGKAAGSAAALAASTGRNLWDIPGEEVRARLAARGAGPIAPEVAESGVAINPASAAFLKESGL